MTVSDLLQQELGDAIDPAGCLSCFSAVRSCKPGRLANRRTCSSSWRTISATADLGCYGGEIATPQLDSLAAENGLRFSQFYNTARCWPSRAALMTGYYAQQVRRDKLMPAFPSGGGNRGKTPCLGTTCLPKLLKPAGYRSYHSGKWHIDGMPLAEGFDRSYYLRDQGRFFSPKKHWEDDVELPPVERGSGYYGTIAVVDHAVQHLKQHAEQTPDQPFLSYVAFAAPHFPLHALPEDIARYEADTTPAGRRSGRPASLGNGRSD